MSGALAMLMGSGVAASLSLSGGLSAAGSTSPVTSPTQTIIGSGTLHFTGVFHDGGGSPSYSKNGAAYSSITEGMTLAVVNGDTLAVRALLVTPGMTSGFLLSDNTTSAEIEYVLLERL